MSVTLEQPAWLELPIQCPHCGNHGEPDGGWETNAWTPFKLVEEVVRSWEFTAVSRDGGLLLIANALDESVAWESDTNLRIECMQCFESFGMPEGAQVRFE